MRPTCSVRPPMLDPHTGRTSHVPNQSTNAPNTQPISEKSHDPGKSKSRQCISREELDIGKPRFPLFRIKVPHRSCPSQASIRGACHLRHH